MNRSSLLLPGLLLLLLTTAAVPALAAEGGDVAGVKAANERFYAALNKLFTGEVAPMEEVWSHAEDTTYMGPSGGYQVGWQAILPVWKEQAALKLGGKIEPAEVQINAGDTIGVVSCLEQGTNTNIDGKAEKISLRATSIYRKEGGTWKMIGHHTDLIPGLGK